MTNETEIQEDLSISSLLLGKIINEADAARFKALYQSINVSVIDSRYSRFLKQEFPIDLYRFREAVLDNISKKTINFSFIEQEPTDENNSYDIGLLLHFSDSEEGCFDEATDNLYRITKMNLKQEDPSGYNTLRANFRKSLGACIAEQTGEKLTEVVRFKMTDVINYLLDNVYGLPRVPDFKALAIDLEMLQYTAEIGNYSGGDAEDKGRISIGSRISYSYFESGTLASGKLPLYNIGTLHP